MERVAGWDRAVMLSDISITFVAITTIVTMAALIKLPGEADERI
jgi:hypothetical protein